MKQLLCMLLCVFFVGATLGFATGNGAKLVSTTGDEVIVTFEVDSYTLEGVMTSKGSASKLVAPKAAKILEKGAPELSKLTAAVAIPDMAKMNVEVLSSSYVDLFDVELAPSKGVLTRNINPADVPYEYGKVYKRNAFYPGTLAELGKPYIARDVRGQNIIVNPFQYNPVQKVLRVYKEITVKVSNTGQQGENILERGNVASKIHPQFKNIYNRHFINYETVADAEIAYTPLSDPIGNYLIVCYSSFMSDMAPFVAWKESLGYDVTLVDYSTIGSSSALKTYVANFYNTNGLTYLLLVGDHEQIPAVKIRNYYADNSYGMIVGSDGYQDIFIGRFSAETSAHVATQVERTIHYERDVLSTASFFNHAIGFGSSEGTGDDDEYDYEHINNILLDCAGYGYTTHECHQAGGSPALMSSLINDGAGVIFYCGHGYEYGWWTSSWEYNINDINALTNVGELPFIFTVACVVGEFKGITCFSETWQRATYNGQPTGAVVNCGATINQSWYSPMCAEDEMADILVSGSKRTYGGVFVNGMFQMIDEYGSDGEKMALTWTVFGDPSLQLRTPGTTTGPSPI
jgi:gingipain R